ncbi:MAG: cytochrome P450 [Deltaproteobacteria bacterium]
MQATSKDLRYPLNGINLKDIELFLPGFPHEIFSKLRRDAPVYWNEEPEPEEPGFWALTRYEDVLAVSKNPELFSSAVGGHQISYPPGVEFSQATRAIVANMIGMDPPEHNAYRKLVSPGFRPKAVDGLEERIRAIVTRAIDAVAARGRCELVSEVAAELPVAVLADLLGIPDQDRRKLFEWSNRLVGLQDPEVMANVEDALGTFAEVFAYGKALVEERRRHPTKDLMGIMAHGEVDGERIEGEMLDGFFLLLVIAGNETTRNSIAGGVQVLAEHPDQRRLLIEDPSLIPGAVEEILRWVSPVIHFRRTATADTEIRGQTIREGDKVVMWYPAANNDEEVFEDPYRFDILRTPNEHLAFGAGQHFCLGARLARLQLKIMFEELLRRLPDIAIDGEVKRFRSYFISGFRQMPVRFTPESV